MARGPADQTAEDDDGSADEPPSYGRIRGDAFADLVVHALRSPLGAMSGWLHVLSLESGMNGSDLAQRAVGGLRRSLAQQQVQIDALSRVLRLREDSGRAGVDPVSLGSLIDAVGEALRPLARQAGRSVRIRRDRRRHFRADADAASLQAALSTFGSHALSHGRPGAPLCLSLAADSGARSVGARITVSIDEGQDGGRSIWQAFAGDGSALPLELLDAAMTLQAQGVRIALQGRGRVPDALCLRFGPPRDVPDGPSV